MRSDLGRKLLAYGVVGVLVAGLAWLWAWGLTDRASRDISRYRDGTDL